MDSEGTKYAQVCLPFEMWIERGAARDSAAPRQRRFPTARVAFRRHHLFGQRGRNESPGTDLAVEISLCHELFIGVQNRKTGYVDFGCKFPAGRYLLSGPQIPTENRITISIV